MRKTTYFLATFILISIFHSCYKDKGNYDYISLNEVTIDTADSGILPSYAVYRYDNLEINPKIYLNGELIADKQQVSDKLSFTWTIFQAHTGQPIYTRDTISNDLKLSTTITKPTGAWILHLAVKDLQTKVETYQRFSLSVSEIVSDGWMALYERDGNTDIGLIVDDRVKTGVIQPRLFLDLIKNSNGTSLNGKPINFIHSAVPFPGGDILVASQHEFVGISDQSFMVNYPFENLFFPNTRPTTVSPGYVSINTQRTEVLINDNKVYSNNFSTSGTNRTNNFFGVPLTGLYGELANWIPTSAGTSYGAIVFDKSNQRFWQAPVGASSLAAFPTQTSSTKFDVNNVGLDLIVSDWGKGTTISSYYEYMLMGNTTNKYLLIANFTSSDAVGLFKYDISTLPGIENVSSISAGLNGEFIYYSSGNKVYRYLYGTSPVNDLVWTAPEGEIITKVSIQKFFYPSVHNNFLPNRNEVVHIATWNENEKNGKVYSFKSNQTNGNIDSSTERVNEGFGKIKDMSYKWEL